MIRLADLGAQTREIWGSLEGEFLELIASSGFIGGPVVSAFEAKYAGYLGAKACVGVGNGTDALELILEAIGIGPGDEVAVPALSFAATSEAVLRVGASPVFIDVAADLLMDPNLLKERMSKRLRAVIPVHLYGNPFDVQRHLAAEIENGLLVIEDAAQAHGAAIRGRHAGSLGYAAAFSFYPGKNLGAWGDAGAVVTDDEALATLVRRLSNHGRLSKFDHEIAGRNSRLDTLQAAVLSAKLDLLDGWVARRRANASQYMEALSSLDWLELPVVDADAHHSWHQFAVRVDDRDRFREFLLASGIETGVHYPYALPDLPFHRGGDGGTFSVARDAAGRVVSLPVGEHLCSDQIGQVIKGIEAFRSPTSKKSSG